MITLDEFVERLCKLGAAPGTRPFPRTRRDREILMQSIVQSLDSSRTYEEREINELLQAWQREIAPSIETDHVTLRRLLIDYGRLERTASGSSYRVGFPQRTTAFELGVYDVDLPATIAAYRESSAKRRALGRTKGARKAK
ncbi:MAG TPA: DUF2087 domain-containing protein [Myxococcota bacterium]|nr:DUF2087 domain-containing protein [Myxococcota bacterium]